MTQEYPCGSFGVFMDFPSARKVLTCKEIKLQEEQEILEAEITATALEGEGKFDETNRDNLFPGRHKLT